MPATQLEISEILGSLNKQAPTGYALGLHIEYTTPRFMFQTYSKAWLDHYSSRGLIMSDPMVAWGFEHVGSSRWSDLEDPAGVMTQAAEFGMPYGVVITAVSDDSRSICGFAKADSEFSDAEIAQLEADITRLHEFTADQALLTPETIVQLKKLSIMVTHPGS